MSEVIVQIEEGLPDKLTATYSELTIERTETGEIQPFGLSKKTNKKRKLTDERIMKEYGYDPSPQKPVKGVWRSKDSDQPITIIGLLGHHNNKEYLLAEETTTGILRDEITFITNDDTPSKPSAETGSSESISPAAFEALQSKVEELSGRVGELEGQLAESQRENSELKTEKNRLEKENKQLREEKREKTNTAENIKTKDSRERTAYMDALIEYWGPRSGEEVPIEIETAEDGKRIETVEVKTYDPIEDTVTVVDNQGQELTVPRALVAAWIAQERIQIPERTEEGVAREERWIDTTRGRALGAAALAGAILLAGVVGYHLKDDGKSVENNTNELVVVTEDLVEKQKEENNIEKNRLAVERDLRTEAREANDIARDLLRAEKYENKLQDKENRIRLQQLRAQQYANRLEREKAAHEKAAPRNGNGLVNDYEEGEVRGASSIFIERGHGFTHELQDMFPGYSGRQYFQVHLAAVEKFGEDYVSNVPKYTTPQGDIRFGRSGEALIRPSVRTYIQDYLKSH